MRALVAGWFSFHNGHATAGDLMVRDVVCEWLTAAGLPHDVAVDPAIGPGVDWRKVSPEAYTHLVFTCGPFLRGPLEREILARFARHKLIGLDLSMDLPLETWNPFDLLIERDSSTAAHADFAFLASQNRVPVVGVCLVEEHSEAVVGQANALVERLLASREVAIVPIDTRLDVNETGLRSPAEVESLIARVDVLVTTRLHGMVLALKNAVPVVAIDAVPGGAKITRQAETIGWPCVFAVEHASDAELAAALDRCLSPDGRAIAAQARERAFALVAELRAGFLAELANPVELDRKHARRVLNGEFEYVAEPLEPPLVERAGMKLRRLLGQLIKRS